MKRYLDPKILSWHMSPDDYEHWDTATAELRPYEIWRHAAELLHVSPTREQLSDAVSNLDRAIGIRVKTLNELYKFKRLFRNGKRSKVIEEMAGLGIVRPFLLAQIRELRNAIEHRDIPPPSENRCAEFVEFTWYFLRSTDTLVRGGCSVFIFGDGTRTPLGDRYWLSVSNGPSVDWRPKFRGWLPVDLVRNERKKTWIEVSVENQRTREELCMENFGRSASEFPPGIPGGELGSDLYFDGTLDGPADILRFLAERYFEARMRWIW